MGWSLPHRPIKRIGTTRDLATTVVGFKTITADATPHTKGPWTELIAAISDEGLLLLLGTSLTSAAAVNTSTLLDIGIGAVGSEVALIENLGVGYAPSLGAGLIPSKHFQFPIRIPSGVRLSARCQSAVVSKTVDVIADVFGGEPVEGVGVFAKITNYGLILASSRGTILTAGAAHVKGVWAELSASTSDPIEAIAVSIQGGGSTAMSDRFKLIDIGVGAVGSEVAIVSDLSVRTTTAETSSDIEPSSLVQFATPIPAGTRLSARVQSPGSGDVTHDIIVHGMS